MKELNSPYPDISDILARKESGRRQRATLTFAEKLVILDSLKERVEPLVRGREARKIRQVELAPLSRRETTWKCMSLFHWTHSQVRQFHSSKFGSF
jgi:hypothetical protein